MEYQLQLFKKRHAMWKVVSDNEINLSSSGSITNNFAMLTSLFKKGYFSLPGIVLASGLSHRTDRGSSVYVSLKPL